MSNEIHSSDTRLLLNSFGEVTCGAWNDEATAIIICSAWQLFRNGRDGPMTKTNGDLLASMAEWLEKTND